MKARLAMTLLRRYGPALAAMLAARSAASKGRPAPGAMPGTRHPTRSIGSKSSILRTLTRLASQSRR